MYPYLPPKHPPGIHLAITLNDIIRLSFVGPGDQRPPSDSPVFKHFSLPSDKYKPFSRVNFVNELVRSCGQFEVMPHDYLQFIWDVDVWSRGRVRYWQRMYDALNTDYEPLHNYDRTEEETIKDDRVKKIDSNANSKVAGFDSGELVDDSAAIGNSTDVDDDLRDRHLRAYGNIGVTSSQELLLQEINVAEQSMVKIIIEEFKQEFCLVTY